MAGAAPTEGKETKLRQLRRFTFPLRASDGTQKRQRLDANFEIKQPAVQARFRALHSLIAERSALDAPILFSASDCPTHADVPSGERLTVSLSSRSGVTFIKHSYLLPRRTREILKMHARDAEAARRMLRWPVNFMFRSAARRRAFHALEWRAAERETNEMPSIEA